MHYSPSKHTITYLCMTHNPNPSGPRAWLSVSKMHYSPRKHTTAVRDPTSGPRVGAISSPWTDAKHQSNERLPSYLSWMYGVPFASYLSGPKTGLFWESPGRASITLTVLPLGLRSSPAIFNSVREKPRLPITFPILRELIKHLPSIS